MTREEAIKYGTDWLKDEYLDAKDGAFITIALETLKQEPFDKYITEIDHLRKYISKLETQIVEQEPCEDVISREEAIDACNQSVNILEATDRIKDLPPVTPQEPFMNKPCVAHQVCHEDKVKILDKIRAEIEGLTYYWCEINPKTVIDDALQIIDKYKAESEE